LADRRLASLLLLFLPVPFYALSVAYGNVPIFTPAWWPFSYYNIRYGIQLLPAIAVFFAMSVFHCSSWIKAREGRIAAVIAVVALVVASYATVWRSRPVSYREAWVNSRTRLQLERMLGEQLENLPPNATLLMFLGEHVGALQNSGIPLKRTINEGNHRVWKQPSDAEGLWERALSNPAQYADYAIAFEGDAVWQTMASHGYPILAILSVNGQRRATILRTR
jgi:hypothetical protein